MFPLQRLVAKAMAKGSVADCPALPATLPVELARFGRGERRAGAFALRRPKGRQIL